MTKKGTKAREHFKEAEAREHWEGEEKGGGERGVLW